jgi:hypothetical protein
MSPTLETRCGLLLKECLIVMDLLRKMLDTELFVELQEDIADVLDELELLANAKNQPTVTHGTN